MPIKAERLEQISVFLENRAGVIAEVCNALTDQDINIQALTVVDSYDISTMRMVVDRAEQAKEALRTAGAAYVAVPVLRVSIPNIPGALGTFGEKIANLGVNVEYMYASSFPGTECVCVVIRVGDNDIERVLELEFEFECDVAR